MYHDENAEKFMHHMVGSIGTKAPLQVYNLGTCQSSTQKLR